MRRTIGARIDSAVDGSRRRGHDRETQPLGWTRRRGERTGRVRAGPGPRPLNRFAPRVRARVDEWARTGWTLTESPVRIEHWLNGRG